MKVASKIVDFVLEGFNGTIFAYGQTGTGKTWTMEGDIASPDLMGITPRAFKQIFDTIAVEQAKHDTRFLVSCQFVEIYQEEVMDLLMDGPPRPGVPRPHLALKEKEDKSVYVEGVNKRVVRSVSEMMELFEKGKAHRAVGATKMNPGSSRSHCIFTITVERADISPEDGKEHIRVGKLNLVDLAGSERQSKTEATGERLKEATKINLSLSMLGQVITSLTSKNIAYVPYRNSKLTRLLQDSLGGNSKTVMIANVGPANYNRDETLETLRFASRAKLIKNKPRVNEDPKDTMLRQLQDDIARLREAIELAERAERGEPGAAEALAKLQLELGQLMSGPGAPKISEQIKYVGVTQEELDEAQRAAAQRKEEAKQALQSRKAALEAEGKSIESKAESFKVEVLEKSEKLKLQQRTKDELKRQLMSLEEQITIEKKSAAEVEQYERRLMRAKQFMQKEEDAMIRRRQLLEQKEQEFQESLKALEIDKENHSALTEEYKRLDERCRKVKQQLDDLEAIAQKESSDITSERLALEAEIAFQEQLIRLFVPDDFYQNFASRFQWDPKTRKYTLVPLDLERANAHLMKPPSTYQTMRTVVSEETGGIPALDPLSRITPPWPVTNYEKTQRLNGQLEGKLSMRFSRLNLCRVGLDVPDRTTADLGEPEEFSDPRYSQSGIVVGGAAAGVGASANATRVGVSRPGTGRLRR